MMRKTCKHIEEMLVDHADGRLLSDDSSEVVEHLAGCERCQTLLGGLQKSLDLADVIWVDSLAETENIRIPEQFKTKRFRRARYAAIAASILLVLTTSVLWRALDRPERAEVTFAEIERSITESATAARLLAAAELLAECPNTRSIVDQQYRHIVETYPQTTAARKAKSRMQ